jgi:hypothetical protein
MAQAVDLFIAGQPDRVRPLLQATRRFLHEAAPGLTEAMKWRVPTFMHGRNLFYLNPQADHVVLGFTNGAQMAEFRGVFDVVLTEVAHVRVRSADDLKRPGLREAVRSAAGFRDVDVRERERSPERERAGTTAADREASAEV